MCYNPNSKNAETQMAHKNKIPDYVDRVLTSLLKIQIIKYNVSMLKTNFDKLPEIPLIGFFEVQLLLIVQVL